MIVAGVDVGAVAAKALVFDAGIRRVLGRSVLPTGWNSRESGALALAAACREAGTDPSSLAAIVGTGYGRVALPFADRSVTEISCHARGAAFLFPETGLVLDIGGQDSKVISLERSAQGRSGAVDDFIMNDKCAAGTGRFLQVLSGILGLPLEELGRAAARGVPAPVSSMCAVFAETEIVGLLARGTPPEDVAAGVFLSIVRRMCVLAKRIPLHGECTFCGGVAADPTFSAMLGEGLGVPVNVPEYPQFVGALGAALTAADTVAASRHQGLRHTGLPQASCQEDSHEV
jgi:predicted CoA-substrate-specific enzyme activase